MNNPIDYWYKKYLQEKNKKTIKILQIKQEWSEEDEEILKLVIARLHSHPNVEFEEYSKEHNWLKSLKERLSCKNE